MAWQSAPVSYTHLDVYKRQGTDFGTKLMGMLDTFPKAFETYWPGLGGIDLLVGLCLLYTSPTLKPIATLFILLFKMCCG